MLRDRDLDDAFDALRRVRYDDSLQSTLQWLDEAERTLARQPPARGRLTRLRAFATAHRTPLAAAAALLLLIAACHAPLEHETTFAHVVTGRIAAPPADARETLAALDLPPGGSVEVFGVVQATVAGKVEDVAYVASGHAVVDGVEVITPSSKFVAVIDGRSGDVREWQSRLAREPGVSSVAVEPVRHTVREPAYRVALQSFSYEFAPAVPPDVAEERIREHLRELRFTGVEVETTTRPDGEFRVRLRWSEGEAEATRRDRAVEDFVKRVMTPR